MKIILLLHVKVLYLPLKSVVKAYTKSLRNYPCSCKNQLVFAGIKFTNDIQHMTEAHSYRQPYRQTETKK